MTSPLDHIDNVVDPGCLADTCEKQGCTVGLEGAPHPFRLIDMDHPDSPAGRDARRRRVRQRKDLARPGMGVPFRGEEYPIQLIRCGEPLAAALR